MRLPKNSIIFFLNFFLAGLASYMGGSALSTYLKYQLFPLPLLPFRSYEFENEKLSKDLGKNKEAFEVILERNIFNAQKTEVAIPEIFLDAGIKKLKRTKKWR